MVGDAAFGGQDRHAADDAQFSGQGRGPRGGGGHRREGERGGGERHGPGGDRRRLPVTTSGSRRRGV